MQYFLLRNTDLYYIIRVSVLTYRSFSGPDLYLRYWNFVLSGWELLLKRLNFHPFTHYVGRLQNNLLEGAPNPIPPIMNCLQVLLRDVSRVSIAKWANQRKVIPCCLPIHPKSTASRLCSARKWCHLVSVIDISDCDYNQSFVHFGYLYRATSSPLLLRGDPGGHFKFTTTQRRSRLQHSYCVGINTPKHFWQLWVKDLPKVPKLRLERDSNLRPFGRKAPNLPRASTPNVGLLQLLILNNLDLIHLSIFRLGCWNESDGTGGSLATDQRPSHHAQGTPIHILRKSNSFSSTWRLL